MKPFTLVLFLLIPACFFGQTASQNSTGSDIGILRTLLKQGIVVKVKVLHLPDNMLTRVAVNPQALRSMASITKTFDQNIEKTFDPVLADISAKRENHEPDLRWGVFFYDKQDHQVASIFVDKFGQHGYLNNETVSFDAGSQGTNLAISLHEITEIKN